MELTQEATALNITSSNLQQIALNASDARIALDSEADNLNFRKEISRIMGVYVNPSTYRVTIDGITFSYENDKDLRQRSVYASIDIGKNGVEKLVKGKITSLSDIGALILEARELTIVDIMDFDHPGVMIDDNLKEVIKQQSLGDEFVCFTEELLWLGDGPGAPGGVTVNYTLGQNTIDATVDASPWASVRDVQDILKKFKSLESKITLHVK